MPKIPQFDRERVMNKEAPAVLVDTRSYGLEQLAAAELFKTQAQSWQDVGTLGKELSEVGLRLNKAMYEAKQVSDLAQAQQNSRLKLYELARTVQQNQDPATWAETFKTEAEKVYGDILGGLSDRQVQGAFQKHWASAFPLMHHGVVTEARQMQVSQFSANLDAGEQKAVELYLQARSDIERAQIKGEYFGNIAGGQQAGVVMPDKAEVMRQRFPALVSDAVIKAEIARDPKAVLEKLTKPEIYYKDLRPEQALQYHGPALAELHRRQEGNLLEVSKLYSAKKLTLEHLTKLRDNQDINVGTFSHYEASLKRDSMPEAAVTDPNIYFQGLELAQKGQLSTEQLRSWVLAGKLDRTDRNQLFHLQISMEKGQTPKEMEFVKTPYFKGYAKIIEDTLEPLDKLTIQEKALTAAGRPVALRTPPSKEATMEFMRRCHEAHAKGELTNDFMKKLKDEIIEFYGSQAASRGRLGGGGATPSVSSFGTVRQPAAGAAQAPAAQAPSPAGGQIRVLNKRTGKYEYLNPEQIDQIRKQQGR